MSIIYNSKISDDKIESIVKGFVQRKDAVEVAQLLNISRHTTERIYNLIREAIADASEGPVYLLKLHASNFKGNFPIVGITVTEGGRKIFTRIVGSMSTEMYMNVLKKPQLLSGLISYRDSRNNNFQAWKDGVLTDPKFKVKFVRNLPFNQVRAIHFIPFTSRFFHLYFGVSWSKYNLYLKELEWRYNMNKSISKSEMCSALLRLVGLYSK